jgi:hypothetical protein
MDPVKVKQEPGSSSPSIKKKRDNLASPIKIFKDKQNGSRPITSSITSLQRKLKSTEKKTLSKSSIPMPMKKLNINEIQVKKEPGTLKNILNKKQISEFMVNVPKIEFDEKENNQIDHNDDESSKFSSPFNSRADTVGTNLTFLTKANTDIDISKSINVKPQELLSSSSLKIEGSSDLGNNENISFLSSPCVDRELKKKRKILSVSGSKNEDEITNKRRNQSKNVLNSNNDNDSFDSHEATDGSLSNDIEDSEMNFGIDMGKRPKTPPKFYPDDKPIYEYMEGEDAIYYEIMGKKDRNEVLDENEKQFSEYVHYDFKQWSEQSQSFVNEYDELLKRVILARIKFNKRFQFLKKNLDEFAINLENHGGEITKKSEILKEYCNKIVTEIE